jgi:hypothetical protein
MEQRHLIANANDCQQASQQTVTLRALATQMSRQACSELPFSTENSTIY